MSGAGPVLRVAREEDAAAVRAIYEPIVRETGISFEDEPPTADEMRRRIRATLATHPWLVCEVAAAPAAGEVVAYAAAGPFRPRTAYRWAAEVALYVRDGSRRRGIGRAIYAALLDVLTRQGFASAYAAIALPNPASVALHEAAGFRRTGLLPAVGFKLGEWRDVGYWERTLAPRAVPPAEPVPFALFRDTPALDAALAAARALLAG